jgi:hypothetical protein
VNDGVIGDELRFLFFANPILGQNGPAFLEAT